jgi:MFS family permease
VVNDAAAQSVLPRLVDHRLLAAANARLQQSGAVAQTSGPLFAGFLVRIVGAPSALLVDACSFVASSLLLRSIRVDEAPRPEADLRNDATLAERSSRVPAGSTVTRCWPRWPSGPTSGSFFNAIVTTVFVPYAVRNLGIDAFGIGVAYACAGVGSVLGGALAGWAGRRRGVGGAVIGSQFVLAVAFLPIVAAPTGLLGLVMVCVGQLLFGVGIGLGSPYDMAYRQAVTPDRLQGRMNATIRSLNWGMIAVAAPLGGLLADVWGSRPALWVGIAGVALTAVGLLASPSGEHRCRPIGPDRGSR